MIKHKLPFRVQDREWQKLLQVCSLLLCLCLWFPDQSSDSSLFLRKIKNLLKK